MVVGTEIIGEKTFGNLQPPRPGRVVFLDTLRFIAAASVLFQHAVERELPLGGEIVGWLSPGVFGVVLFFMVSGFVIPLSTMRGFDMLTFGVRRLFRIYPLVIVAFLAVLVLGRGTDLSEFAYVKAASLYDWAANLLLIQDYVGAKELWGVTWTLSLEVAWYALFGLSLVLLGQRFDQKLVVAAPIVTVALALLSLVIGHRLPLGRIDMIYAAIIGCRSYRNFADEISFRRLLLDAGIFIGTTAFCNAVSFGHFRHPNITMYEAVIPWVLAPVLFLLIAAVPLIRHSALVDNKVIGALGSISYSTYMLHPFAIAFAIMYFSPSYFLVTAVALTLLLSVLGYRFVEMPGQAAGKWLIARMRARERLQTVSAGAKE